MNFELSSELLTLRANARVLAASLRERAADFDRAAAIPGDAVRDAAALCRGDALALVLVIEELAVASAAVAICAAAAGSDGALWDLAGLRGAVALDNSSRSHLVLAAVALGIAGSALAIALDELRQSATVAGADVEKPHWVVADVATDAEAARLLTYKAAQTNAPADIALARLMATTAAQRAVDAALRVAGAAALKQESVLERIARDARAVSLVLGTEEHQRATAAEGLFPR
jgi:alkylation response protein AidB-like acyl-CoA dehydrogenase